MCVATCLGTSSSLHLPRSPGHSTLTSFPFRYSSCACLGPILSLLGTTLPLSALISVCQFMVELSKNSILPPGNGLLGECLQVFILLEPAGHLLCFSEETRNNQNPILADGPQTCPSQSSGSGTCVQERCSPHAGDARWEKAEAPPPACLSSGLKTVFLSQGSRMTDYACTLDQEVTGWKMK